MRWIIGLLIPVVLAQEPAQATRGRKIYFDSEMPGSRCGNCHLMEKKGTPAGPDLSRLAVLNPRRIKMAVMSTITQYVQQAKLKAGESIPVMIAAEENGQVKLFDFSTNPPQARTFQKEEITKLEPNTIWKHPPESAKLSAAQLADVIGFIRYASNGDKREVKSEDVD